MTIFSNMINAFLTTYFVCTIAASDLIFPDFQQRRKTPVRLLRPSSRRADRLAATATANTDYDDTASSAATLSAEPSATKGLTRIPVNAAGMKCEDSALVEASGAKCSLLAKSFGPLGCQRVLADLAAERGKSLEGVPAAFRTRRVADACPHSCGLCEVCAPGCAKWFIGNGWCEPDCNVKSCQWDGGDCWETDCILGPWEDLSNCSITCDPRTPSGSGGYQTRSRSVLVKPSAGGKKCPALEEKVYGCNANVPCPVECEVSPWGAWSNCSASCGVGTSFRNRTVVRAPANGAENCPELKQSRPCFLTECPADCEVSPWTDWTECTANCGGGTQYRIRDIVSYPIGPKVSCPALFDERLCNQQPCDLSESLCKYTPWTEWSDCNATCGEFGISKRQRQVLNPHSCPASELEQTKACNRFECVVDCELSEWTEWTSCSSKCGEGKASRHRTIVTEPSAMGRACGALSDTKRCFSAPCPIDCVVSDWSRWSSCSIPRGSGRDCGSGSEMRSRSVVEMPSNGGATCPPLVEFRDCDLDCGERRCIVSPLERSEWTPCQESCQVVTATNEIRQSAQQFSHSLVTYWTPDCQNVADDVRECPSEVCEIAPRDCLVGGWGPWTDCTSKCDGGQRSRERSITRNVGPGGKPCPVLIEVEDCGVGVCPIDCELGSWSDWSVCSVQCGLGTQMRSRPILTPANKHPAAKACGPVTQVAACYGASGVCDQDCILSEWSAWSACDQGCGSGLKRRQRTISQRPIGRGTACAALEELVECNEEPCPLDCLLGEWSDWSECSTERNCNVHKVGSEVRRRPIIREAQHGGSPCDAALEESRLCYSDSNCAKLSCNMTAWSPCSTTCGEGEMFRDPVAPLGKELSSCAQAGRQRALCFEKPCSVDCVVSDWSEWERCSAPCGGGDRKRTREIIVPAASGGALCPHLWEVEACNDTPCTEATEALNDCQMSTWAPWSPCSQPCGGGITRRTRVIERPSGVGGKSCGPLVEVKGCNLQRCQGETCDDTPRLADSGITCNILKTQGCTTGLWDLSRTHGVELPEDVPPEARVMDACPDTCGVCEECAPGCQLRDLGNTVCTPECDVEACEYDRGDCGGDCVLPEDLSAKFLVQPSVTALQEDHSVELRCPSGQRFEGRGSIDSLVLLCGSANGQSLALHLLPTATSSINDALDDLGSLACQDDKCPYIMIDNLKADLTLYNGYYARSTSAASEYHRQAGLRRLVLNSEHHADGVQWVLSERNGEHLPNLYSATCMSPSAFGADISPSCSAGKPWHLAGNVMLRDPLTLRCLSNAEKREMQAQMSTSSASSKLRTGPQSFMPVKCEDIKLVEQLSGYSCSQLERAVGCDFPLAEAGHTLPPFLPQDAAVYTVCPYTCDQCLECSHGCAIWFLGNGHCDPACDNEGCNFDEGDCHQSSDRLLEEAAATSDEEKSNGQSTFYSSVQAAATSKGDTSHLESSFYTSAGANCQDDPMVVSMGFSCALLKLGSELPGMGGCNASIIALAASQGITVQLPKGVPDTVRVLDACPVTCNCCDCDRLLSLSAEAISSTSAIETPCSDSDIVESQSGFTCGELHYLLGTCAINLNDLGYLPEGMTETITLEQLCPFSCGTCQNDRVSKYKCHDFGALQNISGFTCPQAVSLLGSIGGCSMLLSSFGQSLPAVVPPNATLATVCADSCGVCSSEEESSNIGGSTSNTSSTASCTDSQFIKTIANGMECGEVVELYSDCSARLVDLGFVLPSNIPESATLAQSCPVSCQSCDISDDHLGVCADSDIVTRDLKKTCTELIAADGCATRLAASSLEKHMPELLKASETRVGDLCRLSCGYCGNSPTEQGCKDQDWVTQIGYTCNLFMQFAFDGCQTPISRLLGKGETLPAGVPPSTTIQDACPKSCQVCSEEVAEGVLTTVAATCEDSPLLAAVKLSCSQVILMAGGGGTGCNTEIAAIAGNLAMASMLPSGYRVMDLCQRSCHLCAVPTCDDGYMNGNEDGIDCGGGQCRPCRQCSSVALKTLASNVITSATNETDNFDHGAQRIVTCREGYQSSLSSLEMMKCNDGTWSTLKTKCDEKSVEVWQCTLGFTHAADFGPPILLAIIRAWSSIMTILLPEGTKVEHRLSAAGSCAAMTQTSTGDSDCEDNALVEQMGFGCSLLAGLGCSQSLAELAAMQSMTLPASIPSDALVSDACPVTCDTCEEAQERLAAYNAATSSAATSLGSDCFKAVVQSHTNASINFAKEISAAVGSEAILVKLLSAAFRDFVSDLNITIYSNWTQFAPERALKYHQNALSFILSRPVELSIVAADESTSQESEATDVIALPFSQTNVSTSSWETSLATNGTFADARRVFKYNGLLPTLILDNSIELLRQRLKPTPSQMTSLTGKYFSFGKIGSRLSYRAELMASCEDSEEGQCCSIKSVLQSFLDGHCGSILYASTPSDAELAAFCRVPESESGTLSCYAQLLIGLHPYRDRGVAPCIATDAALDFLASLCAVDPVTGSHCVVSLAKDVGSLSYASLTMKTSDELDLLCHRNSCLRAQLLHLEAVADLTVGLSAQGQSLDQTHESTRLLSAFPRRRLESTSSVTDKFDLLTAEELGSEMLDVICTKVEDDYCQQTLQLLMEEDPVTSPDLMASPCPSACFAPVVGKMGNVLRRLGWDLRAPRHLALGSLMSHYGRFACLKNEGNEHCWSQNQKAFPRSYSEVFNVTQTYSSVGKCVSCPTTFLADAQCDRDCFTPDCAYDRGDCLPWNMFPKTIRNLLDGLCLESIDDYCNPLKRGWECLGKCRSHLNACVEKKGCCFYTALASLRALLRGQRDLMNEIQKLTTTDSVSDGHDNAYHSQTFYDVFDLDTPWRELEKTCNLHFNLTCSPQTSTLLTVLQVSNLRDSHDSSTGRRLSDASNMSLFHFLSQSPQMEDIASFFQAIPADITRLEVRQYTSRSVLLEIRLLVSSLTTTLTELKSEVTYRALHLLQKSSQFWKSVSDKSYRPQLGIEDFMKTHQIAETHTEASQCFLHDLRQTAGRGLVLASIPETKENGLVDQGTSVSLSCLNGYIPSSNGAVITCDNGLWVKQGGLVCSKPCTQSPLDTLDIDKDSVYVHGTTTNEYRKLFSPMALTNQTVVTKGSKYPSGSSMLLSCAQGYTADIAGDWAVAATSCHNGKWTQVHLNCQPLCPSVPLFALTLPEAYEMSDIVENRFGGRRTLSCANGYFAIPPTFEGCKAEIRCMAEGAWSLPEFRCVTGFTSDPTGTPGTVKKMLSTLFSRTGVMSLLIFFACMVIVIILVAILWKCVYRSRADKAYAEQSRLLHDYLASTMTGESGQTVGRSDIPLDEQRLDYREEQRLEELDATDAQCDRWQCDGSPSSSTVSAVRRVVLLAGTASDGKALGP